MRREVTPAQHVLDMGYVSGENIARSSGRHIELIGPARPDGSRQAHLPGGITLTQFELDYDHKVAHCPAEQASVAWTACERKGHCEINIRFAAATCAACPRFTGCVMSKTAKPRGRTLHLRPYYEVLAQQRQKQTTFRFKQVYKRRAGIEATLSWGVRSHGLRRSRYIGLQKTQLQHSFIAVACNLKRAAWWLAGRRAEPRGRRPKSMALPAQSHVQEFASTTSD